MRKGRSLAVQSDCIKGRVMCGTVYGINRKIRVSYPGPGFLSSATKKHDNGLNQTKLIMISRKCINDY